MLKAWKFIVQGPTSLVANYSGIREPIEKHRLKSLTAGFQVLYHSARQPYMGIVIVFFMPFFNSDFTGNFFGLHTINTELTLLRT